MKENQVILKRQKISTWFELDAVRPLTFFVILACLLGWIPYIASALGVVDITATVGDNGSPANWTLGPLLAAAIVSAFLGRAGLINGWRRLTTFRAAPGWYILALVAPVVIVSAAVLVNSAFGAPLPTASQLSKWTDLPGVFVVYLLLVGIGEEVGWTAFAASLLRRHTFINAWLILAAIRVFWHLPLMITGQLSWTLGIGGDIAFQFLMLWLFRRSSGVWLLAAIWHAMLNTTSGGFFFPMVQGPDQARLGLLFTIAYVLMAAAVYLFDHRHLDSAEEFSRAEAASSTVVG
jgi:Type II CAAX prenyl endopeptidase Rce1-like